MTKKHVAIDTEITRRRSPSAFLNGAWDSLTSSPWQARHALQHVRKVIAACHARLLMVRRRATATKATIETPTAAKTISRPRRPSSTGDRWTVLPPEVSVAS
uniref:Uncharacterized protein n=1 Tax=Strombidinopsis acuminata TaxID=141414 RepID=A0A7S3W296_9SPIT|mmetsp:Transcript_117079/g.162780  ORF Transcript_117079/g.162780 Transcript_117079/m.162780 type:complete len:102 (+) Transcript_117079:30-335(+)